jgi:hypothetical protein
MDDRKLDFVADFWEKQLDYEPESVDNIYSKDKKGITYATDDYFGFGSDFWLQSSTSEEVSTVGTSKSRAKRKRKNRKHNSNKN